MHGGSGGLGILWREHVRKKGGRREQKGGERFYKRPIHIKEVANVIPSLTTDENVYLKST